MVSRVSGIDVSPSPISAIARGDGRDDSLAKPVARAMLSDRLHGRDPGRYSQVSNTAWFFASAILPDGSGDVLGLWFQANEGATVRAKGLNDLRNRSVQDILIAVVDAEAAEAVLTEVEDHDPVAKYPAPAPNWRRAWTGGIPFLDDPPEGRKRIHTATVIEAQTSKPRRAVRTRGHFPSDAAAAKSIYLAQTATFREWARAMRQWQAVKSQRAMMFEDRFQWRRRSTSAQNSGQSPKVVSISWISAWTSL